MEVVGWLGVALSLGVSPLQAWRMWRTRGARNVSLTAYILLVLALSCFASYAWWIRAWPLAVAHTINWMSSAVIVILGVKYGGK